MVGEGKSKGQSYGDKHANQVEKRGTGLARGGKRVGARERCSILAAKWSRKVGEEKKTFQ